MRRYRGESLDDLANTLIPCETRHEDPIGNEVYIRRRFVDAYERFILHQDQWVDATTLAKEIAGPKPSRALVAKIYRDLTAKTQPAAGSQSQGKSKSTRRSRRKAARRPKLEELERERREAERAKVRGMRKGTVRKKLLK